MKTTERSEKPGGVGTPAPQPLPQGRGERCTTAEFEDTIQRILAAGPTAQVRFQTERADAKRLRLALGCLRRGRIPRTRYHLLHVVHFTRSAVSRALAKRSLALLCEARTVEARRALEEAYVGIRGLA